MKNIVLIGFMGTGKSTIGRLLAKRLLRPFIDVDKKIEEVVDLSVNQIFELHGEEFFRYQERLLIAKVARYRNTVIATGGGAVLCSENLYRLRKNGVIVSLKASTSAIIERTARRSDRPLLHCEDPQRKIAELLHCREHLYDKADFMIDTTELTPLTVVDQIVTFLRQGGYLRGCR